jgi:hypothetical protein
LGEEKLYLRIAFEIIDLAGKMRGTSGTSLWNRVVFWAFNTTFNICAWNGQASVITGMIRGRGKKKLVARGNMISVYIWIQNVAKGFRIRVYPPTGGWWLINP